MQLLDSPIDSKKFKERILKFEKIHFESNKQKGQLKKATQRKSHPQTFHFIHFVNKKETNKKRQLNKKNIEQKESRKRVNNN